MAAEKQVQDKIVRWLKSQKVWHMKVHGSQYQKAGVPDLLIVYKGFAIFLEVKAKGKKPAVIQNVVMDELKKQGEAMVNWFDNAPDAIRWLELCFASADELLDSCL